MMMSATTTRTITTSQNDPRNSSIRVPYSRVMYRDLSRGRTKCQRFGLPSQSRRVGVKQDGTVGLRKKWKTEIEWSVSSHQACESRFHSEGNHMVHAHYRHISTGVFYTHTLGNGSRPLTNILAPQKASSTVAKRRPDRTFGAISATDFDV